MSLEDVNSPQNLILACPNHHRVMDMLADEYPADKLELMRQWHLERVARILNSTRPTARQEEKRGRLREAIAEWEANRGNDVEEFWQSLLTRRPEILIPVLGGRRFTLRPKSYVGGKSLDNAGGNIVDFLAQQDYDAVLVELKTPTADLIGGRYRGNAYLPSRDLAGSCIQVGEYRASIVENAIQFRAQDPSFRAHSPSACVVIGDLGRENMTHAQRRSFEIFRKSISDVQVITYDEVFLYLEQLAELL